MKKVAEFFVEYFQFLDKDSKVVDDLPEFTNDRGFLISLYRSMVLTRIFDEKAVRMQRMGQLSTFPSSLGQEAVMVGTGAALKKEDVYCPYYRDQGVLFRHGVTPKELFIYWSGDERGSAFSGAREDFPIAVPIATQSLHATGVASAFKIRKQPRVVITMCGEGGTSEGDFYEAINLAGAWNLPVVFIVNNNQWAISVSREAQTKCETIAQKAISAGFKGIQVDGNDIIAVYDKVSQAVENARNGGGPQLIEAITYRLSDHTTADDASRYCPKDNLDKAWDEEPVERFKKYLEDYHDFNESEDLAIKDECSKEVDQAAIDMLNFEKPNAESMFDHLYENFPEALLVQYEELIAMNKEGGK